MLTQSRRKPYLLKVSIAKEMMRKDKNEMKLTKITILKIYINGYTLTEQCINNMYSFIK